MRPSSPSKTPLAVALAAFVSVLTLWGVRPALAQTDDAKTLFAEGRRLRAEGKCAEAIDAFRRALEAWPEGLGSLRNIAQCEETLGRYASARRTLWDLRREALKSDDPKYDGWEQEAEAAHARLEAVVPRLTIRLRGATADEVAVRIDGRELASRLVGVALERDVGTHRVEAWHGGDKLVVRDVLLDAGQNEEVTLAVTLPAKSPTTAPAAASARSPSRLMIAGFVVAGVGVLGAVGAVVAGVVRAGAIDDLEAGCPAYPTCPPSQEGTLERGRTATTLVNVLAIVGGLGVGGGVAMIIAGAVRGGDGVATAPLVLEVAPTVGGVTLSAGGAF